MQTRKEMRNHLLIYFSSLKQQLIVPLKNLWSDDAKLEQNGRNDANVHHKSCKLSAPSLKKKTREKKTVMISVAFLCECQCKHAWTTNGTKINLETCLEQPVNKYPREKVTFQVSLSDVNASPQWNSLFGNVLNFDCASATSGRTMGTVPKSELKWNNRFVVGFN